ncbi:hypothetical protein [Thalassobaculum sp.]|uniref:hypothetical protein n=1 Tax=Thalassobaculum sp. TaxID=2022740 RepID=UPI0032EFCD02
MRGRRRHDRQHHGRVEEADLAAAPDIGVEAGAVDVLQPEQVGEEAAVEAAGLQHPGDVLVAAGVQDVVEGRFRVPPAADMQRGRPGLQLGDQMHLTLGHETSGLQRMPDFSTRAAANSSISSSEL